MAAATCVKIDVAISLSALSSCMMVNMKQYLRYMYSSSSRRPTLRESSSLGDQMGFPLSGVRLGRLSLTWVTCASGGVAALSPVAGDPGISLVDIDWLTWVVNTAEVRGLDRGEPLCELFREHGVNGEELSLFGFIFGLMVGGFSCLSI